MSRSGLIGSYFAASRRRRCGYRRKTPVRHQLTHSVEVVVQRPRYSARDETKRRGPAVDRRLRRAGMLHAPAPMNCSTSLALTTTDYAIDTSLSRNYRTVRSSRAREHNGQARHLPYQASDRLGQPFVLPYHCCLMVKRR